MDDADLIDVVNYSQAGIREFLPILFRQQNDHRVFFSRLGVLLPFWFTGNIDFRLTILIGYLNLVFLGTAFYMVFRSTERRLWYFLPVSLLLFSPIVYQVHLWSITAYQYTLSIAFSISSLYFLQKELSRWWWLSIPFSIAATLTNLDGVGTLPIAFIWLLLQGRRKVAFYYLTAVSIYCLAFFSDFKLSGASQLSNVGASWILLSQSILAITGSLAKVISDSHAMQLSTVLGVMILGFYLFLKFRDLYQNKSFSLKGFFQLDFVEISFLRVLGSAVMIAIGRYLDNVENMVAIRFQLYSVSLVILFYLYVLSKTPPSKKRFLGLFTLAIAIILSGYSYLKYESAVDYYRAGLKADSYNFAHNKLFLHQYFNLRDPDPRFYAFYRFPNYMELEGMEESRKYMDTVRVVSETDLQVTKLQNEAEYKHYLYPILKFRISNLPDSMHTEDAYLMLTNVSNDSTLYFMALRPEQRRLFSGAKGHTLNLVGEFPDKIHTRTYGLALCWKDGDRTYVRRVRQSMIL